jgi:hypothetical protein
MLKIWRKVDAPDIDEMCLVNTAIHKIAAIDGERSDFTPGVVA